jgi:hypothetical protein
MIKGLQGLNGIQVLAGDTSVPFVSPNTEIPLTGMIRIHNSDMQVYDGHRWMNINASYATVQLDTETQNLLHWVKSKQQQEIELLELASKNEAVRIALENVKKAQDQLTITAHLSREHETVTS